MEERTYKGKAAIRFGDRPVQPGETIEVTEEEAAQLDRCGRLWAKPKMESVSRKGAKGAKENGEGEQTGGMSDE